MTRALLNITVANEGLSRRAFSNESSDSCHAYRENANWKEYKGCETGLFKGSPPGTFFASERFLLGCYGKKEFLATPLENKKRCGQLGKGSYVFFVAFVESTLLYLLLSQRSWQHLPRPATNVPHCLGASARCAKKKKKQGRRRWRSWAFKQFVVMGSVDGEVGRRGREGDEDHRILPPAPSRHINEARHCGGGPRPALYGT